MGLENSKGLTLVEFMVSVLILGLVLAVLFSVFTTTNRMYWRTSERSYLQMNSRAAIEVMAQEIRSAGCDPSGVGLGGILMADSDSIRIQADLNGDGAIQTNEPSEDVLYFFDSANQTLVRDPGTGPQIIVDNVTNVTFSYFDWANNSISMFPLPADSIAQVRSIGVVITTEMQRGGQVNYATRVGLRNL